MRYQITIEELRDSTNDYRGDDTYTIYEVKTEGDNSIVTAVQRTVLDYMEERVRTDLIIGSSGGIESDE